MSKSSDKTLGTKLKIRKGKRKSPQGVPPKNPTGAPSGSSAPTPSPKKKMSAGKIILTVFICCTVVVVLFISLMFATFKVVEMFHTR